jgi:flagellar biosynthesis protein FlhF
MRMKSYFAASVQSAMEQARRELGIEAILVTSRLAPAEAGKPRQYEVVFATEIPEKSASGHAAPPRAVEADPKAPEGGLTASSLDAVLSEIKGIRREIQTWLPRTSEAPRAGNNAEREILRHLNNADVDPDLAQQLVASAMERLSHGSATGAGREGSRFADVLRAATSRPDAPAQDIRSAVAACISEVFRVDTGLAGAAESSGPTAVAMIGPPGAGKTCAIAKIAVHYGVGKSRPTLLLSTDNLRVAASEQLRGYAAVLGLRFEMAQSTRAIGQIVEDHRGYGLILIDTPGYSRNELNEAGDLAQFLAGEPGIQKHLTLPAPARCTDMERICSAYEIFHPTHLLFSRTDETTVFGPALSLAMSRRLPVSFFGTGARVPEDISEANAGFIADRLLPVQTPPKSIPAAA